MQETFQEILRDAPPTYNIQRTIEEVIITEAYTAAMKILAYGFDWAMVKDSWNILSTKERFLCLIAHEYSKRETINGVIARESYSYYNHNPEMVFRSNETSYVLVPVRFTGKMNKGEFINGQN